MRVFFGTTAIRYAGSVKQWTSDFRGSHGAIGGVGWKHVIEDAGCQIQVAKFMNAAFVEAKVPVRLIAFPPTSVP